MPEIHFKNASLHIFPSISESFGMVLSETKIYGIPNILIGLDYLSISHGGTIIVYDDNPESIAKEAIKILNNYTYRQKLGKEARRSMLNFRNKLILKRWNQLILSIYNGDNYYQILRNKGPKVSENYSIELIKNQINLLKKRNNTFNNLTLQYLCNFTKMENLKI
jgi:glycosyltransferase involved in cell wall biosynthesis